MVHAVVVVPAVALVVSSSQQLLLLDLLSLSIARPWDDIRGKC